MASQIILNISISIFIKKDVIVALVIVYYLILMSGLTNHVSSSDNTK